LNKLLLVLSLIGIISCSEQELATESFSKLDTRESVKRFDDISDGKSITGVSNKNGRLHFDDVESVNNYLTFIKNMDNVTEKRAFYYEDIGLSYEERDGTYYTKHPAAKYLEEALGFTSFRTLEEEYIRNAMINRKEFFGIISDPYIKSIIDSKRSFVVGCRTYVVKSKDKMAIVNQDEELVDRLNLNFDTVKPGLNVRFINDFTTTFSFNVDEEGRPESQKEIYQFTYQLEDVGNNELQVTNTSFIENECIPKCYEWVYSDGTVVRGDQPDRLIKEGEVLVMRLVDCDGPTVYDTTLVETRACALSGGEFEELARNINITVCEFFEPNFDFTQIDWWQFTELNSGFESPQHTDNNTSYANTVGDIKIELCIKHKEFVGPCCGTFEFDRCECEERGEEVDSEVLEVPNGPNWRFDVLVWVEKSGAFDATPGEVGTRMITYRQKSNGGWEDKCPTFGGYSHLNSRYFDKEEDCTVYEYEEESWRGDCDENQQINHDHKHARKIPKDTYGEWGMNVDGTMRYYKGPNNDGKLYLQ